MAERHTYRMHLTPRGWERGSPSSDALESWEVEVGPGHASQPEKARSKRVPRDPDVSTNLKDLELARSNHGERPRT